MEDPPNAKSPASKIDARGFCGEIFVYAPKVYMNTPRGRKRK
jgi:hypothetical protein